MPQLAVGVLIERLIPSTTGRDIEPGDIGRIDTMNGIFDYFHVQWQRTGLWSMMHPEDANIRYTILEPYGKTRQQLPRGSFPPAGGPKAP